MHGVNEASTAGNNGLQPAGRPMQVTVRLDGERVRAFHLLLIGKLSSLPAVSVSVDARPAKGRIPASAEALFQLETAIHGLAGNGLARRVPSSELRPRLASQYGRADLVLDLCGDVAAGDCPIWRTTYNGASGEEALLAVILAGETPVARLLEGGRIVAEARLGTEFGGIAVASFEDSLARTVTLIAAAMRGAASGELPRLPSADLGAAEPRMPSGPKLGVRAAKSLARRVLQRIYHLCYNAPHWKVGWRKTDGSDLYDLRAHPSSGWRLLPDDGSRFYADPFPILHKGALTLFVEDFIHSQGKAIISAVQFDNNGPLGTPKPVLETPYHLSYPFVFEREGSVWMIPESCGNGTVDLYRATAFPGGWVKEATLLSGIVASDATLVERDGRWWMFATVREDGGAFSDALHLWSAPDFRGPWQPHPKNPVLIDIASARPAGRMVDRNGALLRPVQDCRKGYGAALGIARVTRLDADGFAQEVETILSPGERWAGRKMHTLNEAGGLEFTDGSALAPRWKRYAAGRSARSQALKYAPV